MISENRLSFGCRKTAMMTTPAMIVTLTMMTTLTTLTILKNFWMNEISLVMRRAISDCRGIN